MKLGGLQIFFHLKYSGSSSFLRWELVVYISGSQPFGLQVPVKDKFLSYCPDHIFLRYCVPELCVLWTQKHQIDAKFACIIVFLLIKPNNSVFFQGEISEYLILINLQVPVRKTPSPGTGTRPGGLETLVYMMRSLD